MNSNNGGDVAMRKIGRETLFLRTSENNPRNGESAFARLKDGRICLLFTEYYGSEGALCESKATDDLHGGGNSYGLKRSRAIERIAVDNGYRLGNGYGDKLLCTVEGTASDIGNAVTRPNAKDGKKSTF